MVGGHVRGSGMGRVRAVAVGVVAALVVTLGASTVTAGETGSAGGSGAVMQEWASAAASPVVPDGVVEEPMPDFVPARVSWPTRGAADVVVPARGVAGVGATVVSVGAPGAVDAVGAPLLPGSSGRAAGEQAPSPKGKPPESVRVEVLDRVAAEQVGGVGVALLVTPSGQVRGAGSQGGDLSGPAGPGDGVGTTAAPGTGTDTAAVTAGPGGGTDATGSALAPQSGAADAAEVTAGPDAAPDGAAGTGGPSGLARPGLEDAGPAEDVSVWVSVDVSGFAGVFGGDFLGRARLSVVPECVRVAVAAGRVVGEDCQEGRVVLETVLDREAGTLSAEVPLSASGSTMVAVTGSASGSSGTFAATPVGVAGDWEVGTGSGSFEWSYPLPVAPAVVGDVPGLDLSYSSGSVDGMTAGDNAQAPKVGVGWGITEAFVEQLYASCGVVTWDKGSKDLCYEGDHYRIVLNGRSSVLVEDEDAPGASSAVRVFRLRDDPGWRVELRRTSVASNPDEEKATARTALAYNLAIQDIHTYHVGQSAILVHNTCSLAQRAEELAARAGRNRVSVDTPTGRLSVDLKGKAHYEKSLGSSVDTPHTKFETRHVGPNGQVSYTSGPVGPASWGDIRIIDRILSGRGY